MHIAFLNPQGNFDPHDRYWTEHADFGGQLVYVKETALALAGLGHDVDLLTRRILDPEWPEFAGGEDVYPGSTVRILRIPCGPDGFLPKEQLWPHLATDWVDGILAYYEKMGGLPDLFTAHYGDGGLAAVEIRRRTGRPFSFTAHSLGAQKLDKLGMDAGNFEALDTRYRFSARIEAERMSMAASRVIITSTEQERREQYGHSLYHGAIDPRDDARFSVVPPGVNLGVFSPDPKAVDEEIRARIESALQRDLAPGRRALPLVVCSSRLDSKKNHIGVVRAFAGSEALRSTANLAIVVRGLEDPIRDFEMLGGEEAAIFREIVAFSAQSGMSGAVVAFPLNSQEELAAAYRVLAGRRSVFCLTALYEPFGLAPLEAMSCGLPAVVTKNGGPSESLLDADGTEYGVLVDPLDPAAIAAGLLRVTGSAESWAAFQAAGAGRIRSKYTWERTAEGYLAALDRPDRSTPEVEMPAYFLGGDYAPLAAALSDRYLAAEASIA